MSRYFQVYKFTREDGVHGGRWLSAAGDGAMRWVSTRGDAHKLTRTEAESLAKYIERVYIGHLALVVGDAQSPLEALAKPSTVKRARANPSHASGPDWLEFTRRRWGPKWAIVRNTPANRERYGRPITKSEYARAEAEFAQLTSRKAASGSKRPASSGARSRRSGARSAGAPRFRYCAEARARGARKPHVVMFNAQSDEAARAYCKGLLLKRLPNGAQVTRLERVGPASSSAKGSKKN